ncbi:hypothetical protein ASE04_12410 [Rhizobium sp. Root708]|uniref:hypothetical protein n=1 Tax=Rhizobium sp. Root708 TaxID=1736592 RepID=UPI0006F9E230|nr:hypothetical protein [Rhizobium sp. Root708]KRB50726.1 hypothetical protein ASE04_12410 [Rhizobium sp. Root708]
MQLIDPQHPAYRPLWARILIVAVCLGWAVVEIVTGDPFWAVLAGGAGVYAAYMLLWSYKPPAETPDAPPQESPAAEKDED